MSVSLPEVNRVDGPAHTDTVVTVTQNFGKVSICFVVATAMPTNLVNNVDADGRTIMLII
jgi:hypothetical protein